jgi:hypothetical protein
MKPQYIFTPLAMFMICLASCSQPKETLSDSDRKLVDELTFDRELIGDIRKHTDSSFRMAAGSLDAELSFKDPTVYKNFREKKINGLSFSVSQEMSYTILADLHDEFRKKGYLLYISESNSGYGADEITVLKTDDMFDALRFEGTNGINYDIHTEDIIDKLKTWNDQFGLDIFAASFDLVQAHYVKMPSDLKAHAEETYAFCPDVVDQGTGSVEALQQEIQKARQLYLWWD